MAELWISSPVWQKVLWFTVNNRASFSYLCSLNNQLVKCLWKSFFLKWITRTTMADIVHSDPWHFQTIQSMCFDCWAGSGSPSKWITPFPFFRLPVCWLNPFTSGANSSPTSPPLSHTHTPAHPWRTVIGGPSRSHLPTPPTRLICMEDVLKRS